MAIAVDPMTHIITVPQADLSFLGGVVYGLDVDTFRMWLKDWEDDQDYPMCMLKTHNHNTEVSLSGITYARIVEVLAPYTVEFEDGQYMVSCSGANHNLADVKVANQVSLLINNAAGLISNAAIEYSSFNGGVTIDIINGVAGTIGSTGNPIGTPRNPSNNLTDTLQIANNRGFKTIFIKSSMTGVNKLDSGTDLTDFMLTGISDVATSIEIDASLICPNLSIRGCYIYGTLDGGSEISDCEIGDLAYVNGHIHRCGLSGTITLDGSEEAVLTDCFTPDQDSPVEIDMGGSGQDLSMPNYSGLVTISNLNSATEEIGIGLNAGMVVLKDTITAGTVIVSGTGMLLDEYGVPISTGVWNGGVNVNVDTLVNNQSIANAVWANDDGLFLLKIIQNKRELKKNGLVWELVVYEDNGTTELLNKVLKDSSGNNISDLAAGTMARELANSV